MSDTPRTDTFSYPSQIAASNVDMVAALLMQFEAMERELTALRAECEALRKDAARLEWVLPIVTGEDDAVTNERTLRVGTILYSGLTGRAAIDEAMKK